MNASRHKLETFLRLACERHSLTALLSYVLPTSGAKRFSYKQVVWSSSAERQHCMRSFESSTLKEHQNSQTAAAAAVDRMTLGLSITNCCLGARLSVDSTRRHTHQPVNSRLPCTRDVFWFNPSVRPSKTKLRRLAAAWRPDLDGPAYGRHGHGERRVRDMYSGHGPWLHARQRDDVGRSERSWIAVSQRGLSVRCAGEETRPNSADMRASRGHRIWLRCWLVLSLAAGHSPTSCSKGHPRRDVLRSKPAGGVLNWSFSPRCASEAMTLVHSGRTPYVLKCKLDSVTLSLLNVLMDNEPVTKHFAYYSSIL